MYVHGAVVVAVVATRHGKHSDGEVVWHLYLTSCRARVDVDPTHLSEGDARRGRKPTTIPCARCSATGAWARALQAYEVNLQQLTYVGYILTKDRIESANFSIEFLDQFRHLQFSRTFLTNLIKIANFLIWTFFLTFQENELDRISKSCTCRVTAALAR